MRPVLLCFDGSDNARWAIRRSAELLGRREAIVLFVSESSAIRWTAYSASGLPAAIDYAALEAADAAFAEQLRGEGLALATEAGFDAEAIVEQATDGVAGTIDRIAVSRGVDAVVIGARGHSALVSALLGSVANAVLHRSSVPVIAVPPER